MNVAARLEALSEPGGVCLSGTVRDHIGDRLTLAFDDLGEKELKNISRPVRVYRTLAFGAYMVGVAQGAETEEGARIEAVVLALSTEMGAAKVCRVSDHGAGALIDRYMGVASFAERKALSEIILTGIKTGLAVEGDRNFPAVCKTTGFIVNGLPQIAAFIVREIANHR